MIISEEDIEKYLGKVNPSKFGYAYMLSKLKFRVLYIEDIDTWKANCIKQDMLSIGGEVVTSKTTVNCKSEKTNIVIAGTMAQITKLKRKIKQQKFNDIYVRLENALL